MIRNNPKNPVRAHRKLAAIALAASAVILPLSRAAIADTDSWIGTTSGNWTDNTQWSTGNAPSANQDVNITNAYTGTQTITYDYAGPAITFNSVTVDATTGGTNVLAMSTNTLTVGTAEYIGANGVGVFNQSGGSNSQGNSMPGTIYLGYSAGSNGTYTLSGGNFYFGTQYIGYSGTGYFNQSTSTNSYNGVPNLINLSLGENFGSSGTYTLSGGQLNAISEEIGFNGVGNFIQSGGTNTLNANSQPSFSLGDNAGSTGFYTLSGGLLNVNTSYDAAYVGYMGTGNFNQSGGTFQFSPYLRLGFGSNATGTYTLSNGILGSGLSVEEIGWSGLGTFTQSGGTNNPFTIYVGRNGGSDTYNLSGGNLATRNEAVGLEGYGADKFNQTGGTNTTSGLTVSEFTFLLPCIYALSAGNLNLNTGSYEIVGQTGTGIFNQSGGTNTLLGSSYLAIAIPSTSNTHTGTNTVTGSYTLTGGTLTSGGGIYVGGTPNAPGGIGSLSVSGTGQLTTPGTLQIWNTGTVTLASPGTAYTTVGNIQIAPGGLLDITNTALTINYGSAASPNAAIQSYISTGYNTSASPWTGKAITSSAAALDPVHHTVAFADGSDGVVINLPPGISTAIPNGGVLPPGTELVTYAYAGDANLDGKVDFSDFVILSNHYGGTYTNWDQGNFNYDNTVDFSDFVILSNNFGQGVTNNGASATPQQLAQYNALAASFGISQSQIAAWDATIANLPEPASAGLFSIPAAALLARRRKIRKSSALTLNTLTSS
ncbi:MAG: hypothetical protein M3O30_10310 [Planctomycetota bacterium]|nr:hypothetical protein [Planctomycetota bacterium]